MMINETLKGLDFCFAYLDDFNIYSTSEKEHGDYVCQVSDCLYQANIKIKLTKGYFLKAQLHFLGTSTLTRMYITFLQKPDVIKSKTPHQNIKELRELIELMGYY